MKKTFQTITKSAALLISGAIVLTSCGGEAPTNLSKLHTELDSLKVVRAELNRSILAVEEHIEDLDTVAIGKFITTFGATAGEFNHYFEVYGNVESDKSAIIYAENPGVVRQITVREGQEVTKGQRLVSLDTQIIDRNIDEVKTSLDLATTLYQKQKKLWDQNVGSEVQYLEAKNRMESLESSLATLEEQRNKSTVYAPFTGVVDKIYPKVGEMAGGQSPIIRIVNLKEVYINADVSERYVSSIKKGDMVTVIANRTDTIESSISKIGSFINSANRTFEIRVDINETLTSARPNSLVVLKINDYKDTDAVIIPSSIIMQDGSGRDYVFLVTKNEKGHEVATKTLVNLGPSYEGNTVIENGVKPGDVLVDKGSRSVRGGDKVQEVTL